MGYLEDLPAGDPCKILISGASGLIGSELSAFLEQRGHKVYRLVRRAPENNFEIEWSPTEQRLSTERLDGFHGVVNLSGENVASGLWTESKKRKIIESRVRSTRLLCEKISSLQAKPSVLINASAIGYYGDDPEEWRDENSPKGEGFLADVCQNWEAETDAVSKRGDIRVVKLRIGVVISKDGGALPKIAMATKMGMGATLGSGKQFFCWVSITDIIQMIYASLFDARLSGAVNAVSPNPVRQKDFNKILASKLGMPSFMKVPSFVLRATLGGMSSELLNSMRIRPQKFIDAGYNFAHSELESVLDAEL